jgi:hypothetical protein
VATPQPLLALDEALEHSSWFASTSISTFIFATDFKSSDKEKRDHFSSF